MLYSFSINRTLLCPKKPDRLSCKWATDQNRASNEEIDMQVQSYMQVNLSPIIHDLHFCVNLFKCLRFSPVLVWTVSKPLAFSQGYKLFVADFKYFLECTWKYILEKGILEKSGTELVLLMPSHLWHLTINNLTVVQPFKGAANYDIGSKHKVKH